MKTTNMDAASKAQYLADDPPTIVPLAIKPHFDALADREQKYAHYISVASFAGTRVVCRQISPESEDIYDFIMAIHKACRGDYEALGDQCRVSKEDVQHYLNYAAQFLGNNGNYKSFGDSKFIPRLPASALESLANCSPVTEQLFRKIDRFYETSKPEEMHLGYPSAGQLSTYYPDSDIPREKIEYLAEFQKNLGLMPENTRLRTTSDGYELLIASAVTPPDSERDIEKTSWEVDGGKLSLVYGDHKKEMATIADALRNAAKYAANDAEKKMQEEYVRSFSTGSMQAHKESQRHWIHDKGPMVECNIGFIETYRDPQGIRGEWEGFAAMVNKERTKAFAGLVESAPDQIPKLPWSKDFEKDKFLSPDFTSLEVLSFAGSGIPGGINIPNYDDIRQTEGFKNVSLGNVLSAKAPNEKIPFIRDEDQEIYRDASDKAFEVQVGLHELLGHGCGKLLQETEPGKYNFDVKNPPISPLTEKPITTWYKPGETWGSVFGGMGPSYEECRAECVAMVLSCDFGILKIFGFGDGKEDIHGPAGDILYASYLYMARAGVAALQFWDPKSRVWGQPHMRARHAILKVMLAAGKEFCRLDYKEKDGQLTDLLIHVDRNKIISHGRPAIEQFLQQLQIYKATADIKNGQKMWEDITSVDSWWAEKVRPEVLRKAQPRKVFVQANTFLEGDKVVLKEYPATPEGMIQSFADRTYI